MAFRLARIADPLLISAVTGGLTNPLGRDSATASVFSAAMIE